MHIRSLVGLILVLLLATLSTQSLAGCLASTGTASLGSAVSSYTLYNTPQNTTSTTGFVCAGLVSIASTNTVSATISLSTNASGTQARLYNSSSGDYIPYSICQASGCGTVFAGGSTMSWSSTSFLSLLTLFTAADGSLPLYLRTSTGAQVAAGTYTDTIKLQWNWHLCDVGAAGVCVWDTGSGITTVAVTLVVINDCVITAPNVTFGTAPLVSGFASVNQVVLVECTKGAPYTVGLSNGSNYSGSVRQMKSAGGQFLQYDIYKPDSTRWGPLTTQRRSSASADLNAGIYDGVTLQSYNYRASVIQAQTTPANGTYTDTLTLDVQF